MKHRHIAETLAREIRAGSPGNGAKLPGEHALAVRFKVSRNTVRQALAELARQGMIATESGKGSFVVFDDRTLDQRLGWARALAGQGVTTDTRIVRMELVRDPGLADSLGVEDDEFLAVDRVRAIAGGPAISLECARVPAVGRLREAPDDGLVADSLTATLHAAGRYADHGEERIDIVALDERQAALLGRQPGDTFLHTLRISRTLGGELVEHTDSLLDPARFQIRLQFGERHQ
ncbi:GntR family transcriptional regulator [Rugosimonospora acidiphila]|uniref:GntR family transcriptional regulator n=1 Tax=Rugosimonospora acidiphila TaxID=556531 RepID=A0ABP9SN11_9ACTN